MKKLLILLLFLPQIAFPQKVSKKVYIHNQEHITSAIIKDTLLLEGKHLIIKSTEGIFKFTLISKINNIYEAVDSSNVPCIIEIERKRISIYYKDIGITYIL